MELFFGIFLIIFSLLLCVLIYWMQENFDESIVMAVSGAIAMAFFIMGVSTINEEYSPSITPMDVYRGKTTLEITYRDSVAIDSVVVWKEEVK